MPFQKAIGAKVQAARLLFRGQDLLLLSPNRGTSRTKYETLHDVPPLTKALGFLTRRILPGRESEMFGNTLLNGKWRDYAF